MPKGTLFRLARQKNLLTDLTQFEAVCDDGDFADVRIITLHERAHELAVIDVLEMGTDSNSADLNLIGGSDAVEELLETKYSSMKEFISVEEDQIVIGVDKITINTDAVNYGLSLMLDVPNLNKGEFWELGDEIILRNSN